MNDEMVMIGGSGTKCRSQYWENAECFWPTSFCTRRESTEAVSRICAFKTKRNLWTFGRCLQFKQSCPWASLSYFCMQETSREINAMGRVILRKNVSEKLSIINPLLKEEKPLQFESTNIAAKKPQTIVRSAWTMSPVHPWIKLFFF